MTHRTGCAALRYTTSGNSRSLESARRQQRHDSAWRDYVHGTKVLPMEQPGLWARLFGRRG